MSKVLATNYSKTVANKSQKIVACIITIYQLHSLPEACNEIFDEYVSNEKQDSSCISKSFLSSASRLYYNFVDMFISKFAPKQLTHAMSL